MHYSPKHSLPVAPSTARIRGRIVGLSVAGAATIATGIATSSSAQASGGSVWDRVAACESGGNWSISTGNGFYGGLQFTHSTWIGYGGGRYAGNANGASRSAQIAIAQRVLAGQGPGAWPVCGRKAGLSRSNGGASSSSSAPAPRKVVTHPAPVKRVAAPAKRVAAPARRQVVHTVDVKRVVNAAPALTPMRGVVDSGKTLTVRKGDCLSTLAAKYDIKGGWRALWSLNQAKVSDPNLVFVGQSLHIPK